MLQLGTSHHQIEAESLHRCSEVAKDMLLASEAIGKPAASQPEAVQVYNGIQEARAVASQGAGSVAPEFLPKGVLYLLH